MLFPHFCHVSRTLVGGRFSIWAVVSGEFLVWSVVGGFYGRCWGWSVVGVLHLLVGGRFLFLRMVGDRCLNQYMVGGRWLMVGGLWSVVLYYSLAQIIHSRKIT